MANFHGPNACEKEHNKDSYKNELLGVQTSPMVKLMFMFGDIKSYGNEMCLETCN